MNKIIARFKEDPIFATVIVIAGIAVSARMLNGVARVIYAMKK